MALADTVDQCRSGMLQIAFSNAANERIGGGTGFLSNGYLITNHHVFVGYLGAHRVGLRRDDMPAGEFLAYPAREFAGWLVTGSERQYYDYAVLRIPDRLQKPTDHQFVLHPGDLRVGDDIALLGFPLEHDNLTCHGGKISSFYQSGLARVIQIDASVNSGNSGGPLIDPETGLVIGVVTRKATGLSAMFNQLRKIIQKNIEVGSTSGGGFISGSLDVIETIVEGQQLMLLTLDEIERQANVGIGYAFSTEHLLAEPCMAQ